MPIHERKPVTSIMSCGRKVGKGARTGHINPKKSIVDTLLMFINQVPCPGRASDVSILQVIEKERCPGHPKGWVVCMGGSDPTVHGITAHSEECPLSCWDPPGNDIWPNFCCKARRCQFVTKDIGGITYSGRDMAVNRGDCHSCLPGPRNSKRSSWSGYLPRRHHCYHRSIVCRTGLIVGDCSGIAFAMPWIWRRPMPAGAWPRGWQ